jgi:hypothetical protein
LTLILLGSFFLFVLFCFLCMKFFSEICSIMFKRKMLKKQIGYTEYMNGVF